MYLVITMTLNINMFNTLIKYQIKKMKCNLIIQKYENLKECCDIKTML